MSVQPHAVAALLTDEQKARVRAARFEAHQVRGRRATVMAKIGRRWCCPIAVAIGQMGCPSSHVSAPALGISLSDNRIFTIEAFTDLVDRGQVAPSDIHALLGCSEQDQ